MSSVGAASVQMSLGMELYLEDNSETTANWEEIQSDFKYGNVIFVVIESPESFDLYEPENAQTIVTLYESYYDEFEAAGLVTSFAHPIQAGPGGGEIPDTKKGVLHSLRVTQEEHRSNEKVIYNLHPEARKTGQFDGGDTAVVMIQYGDVEVSGDHQGELFGLLPPSEDKIAQQQVREVTTEANLPDEMDVTITGTPVFEQAAFGLLLPEMITLFGVALVVILVLVIVVMRGKLRKTRRVVFPLVTTLVSVLAMTGMMGYVGFDFNAVMLTVLPVALGLGIDYGLQIQTRYIEERRAGQSPVKAAATATQTAGRAVALALGTTLVGLGSLFVAKVPPVRQFGATTAFSVLVAMVLSTTLLVALLVEFDDGESHPTSASAHERPSGGGLESVFTSLGRVLSLRPALVVLLVGSAVVGGAAAYPAVDTKTDMLDYWPDIEERQDIREMEERLLSPNIIYTIVETDDAYTRETFLEIRKFQRELEKHEEIVTPMSPVRGMEITNHDKIPKGEAFDKNLAKRAKVDRPPTLGQTPSDHPDRVVVQVFVRDITGQTEREVIDYTKETANATLPASMDSRVTGEMVINRNVIENVTAGLTRTTLVSFLAGGVFLAFALRSIRESVLLVGGVAATTLAMVAGGMYLLDVPWNPLTVTTAAIVLGIGVDYGVHVYERFREETTDGTAPAAAVQTAVVQKSRPVLGSGATTMFGFGVLIVSQFPVLSNFGVAISLAMGLAMVTSFVFLPAVIVLLSRRGLLATESTESVSGAD
ncbi:RND family transporter [Halobaculum sp. MBLA0147]|uniref:efflux RND transporter permease subunit n=1 Tax=Halobaculum sp. MBLA0147 TaxID=3079934 RepID=UPI00352551DD